MERDPNDAPGTGNAGGDEFGRSPAGEEAIRSGAVLAAALASIRDAVFIADAQGRFIHTNDAFATYHRFRSKEECSRSIGECSTLLSAFLPDGTEAPVEMWAVARALRGESATNVEYRLRRNDTGETWIGNYSFGPIWGEDGAIIGAVVVARDVTERRREEQILRDSETQFRTLANAIPHLCWMANADGWITWYNQRWYDYTGATPEQMEGWGWQSVHDPGTLPQVLDRWKRSLATGEPFEMVYPLRGADGVYRPFLTRVLPVRADNGKAVGWFGTHTDVSRQSETEQALRDSEKRLRLATEAAGIGTFDWNIQTGVNLWTPELEAMYGLAPGEFGRTQTAWAERVHPADRAGAVAKVEEALATGEPVEHEWRVVWRDGSVHWIAGRFQAFRDASGNLSRLAGVNLDITGRKAAEEALRQSREDLDRAQAVGQIGWWRLDTRANVLTWSPENHHIFGVPEGTPMSYDSFLSNVHPGDREYVNAQWRAALRGESYDIEHRIVAGGEVKWVRERAYLELDEAGVLLGGFGITQDITARKRAEEALRESEERFRLFMDNSPTIAWVKDEEGRHVYLSRAYEERFGARLEEWRGKTDAELWPPAIAGGNRRNDLAVLASGESMQVTEEKLNPDGSRSYWLNTKFPFCDASGRRFIGGIGLDITGLKAAEEALRESERRFRQVAESLPQLVWTCAAGGPCDYLSPQWVRYTGKSEAEQLGYGWLDQLHPEDRRRTIEQWQVTAARGENFEIEFRIRRHDGAYRWFRTLAVPLRDEANNVVKWFGSNTDIDDIKRAEEALRKSEEKYRNLFENMAEEVHFWQLVRDESGAIRTWRLVDANPPALATWGRKTVEEVRGKTTDEIFGPGATEHYLPVVRKIMTEGVPWVFEDYFPHLDRHFRFTSVPFGEYFITTGADITPIKKAQEALQRSEARWNAAIESFAEGAIIATEDERIIYWNPAARRMHGFTRPEEGIELLAETRNTFQLWTHDGGRLLEVDEWPMRRIKRGETVRNLELRLRRPGQGWEKFVSYSGAMVETASGERLMFLSVYDLTEQRKAEQSLQKAIRELERSNRELEQFAYVSAHDLQEPLRQVRAFVDMLRRRHADKFEGTAAEYFAYVHQGASRMSELVSSLLEFSRVGRDEVSVPTSSRAALTAALESLRKRTAETRARITEDDLPTVLAGPTQLAQLFQNLVGNSLKFRRDGVVPEIHVGCRRDGDRWVFSVRDNGIGIDPGFHEKVFAIFHRLHPRDAYSGTGVGLAICKKIVEGHGGQIWVDSEEGKGATFYFTLPAV